MILWLIGLSGSGKTTLGREIHSLLQVERPQTVFLDGDLVRAISGNELGHTVDDRWANSQRISRLCLELDRQGLDVVCAILSIFHESQRWNRENYSEYKEIYLDVTMDTLLKRDSKGLYAKAMNNQEKNVVGVDIEFNPPYAPDLVINNNRDDVDMVAIARVALLDLGISIGPAYRYSKRDLLKHPEKYEYTEFQGSTFLDGYSQSRFDAIQSLESKLNRIEIAYGRSSDEHPWVTALGMPPAASWFLNQEIHGTSLSVSGADVLETRSFLCTTVSSLAASPGFGNDPDSEDSILNLVRRFEVSKKVYTNYRMPGLRRINRDDGDLVNYGLFGAALHLCYPTADTERRFIFLNAILKLNDLLVSVMDQLSTPVELYLALISLKKEQRILAQLRKEYGA